MHVSWILLSLLSAFFAALVAIFGKLGLSDIDSTLATTIRAIIMASLLILISVILGKTKLISTVDYKTVSFIILSGIAGALSWLCYFLALKLGPASGVAALDRLSVAFVILLAFFFLGEAITYKSILGAFLLTAGAILLAI